MTAVNKTIGWGMSACVAALALALNVGVASAQQKAPDPKDAAKSTTPPAPAVKAPAAKDVKAPVAKAPATKAPPACKTLKAEADCVGRKDDCDWIAEAAITKGPNAGKKQAAYCRSLPKKAAPKAAAKAPAAPAPAAKAPAAPAPAAKAPAPAAQPAPAPAAKAPAPAPKN
jgi:hypothetical protein